MAPEKTTTVKPSPRWEMSCLVVYPAFQPMKIINSLVGEEFRGWQGNLYTSLCKYL